MIGSVGARVKSNMGAGLGTLASYGVSALVGALSYRFLSVSLRKHHSRSQQQQQPIGVEREQNARDQDVVRDAYHRTVTKTAADGGKAEGDQQGCCQVVQGVAGERIGYSQEDLDAAGAGGDTTMLGCGTPVELAQMRPGETILDLGCGAGIDCLISAHRVGQEGFVIGVDMTPAMLTEAREQAKKASSAAAARGKQMANISFRLGEIEHLPVPDSQVDCIISNCVINLSPDKPQVSNPTMHCCALYGCSKPQRADLKRRDFELWTVVLCCHACSSPPLLCVSVCLAYLHVKLLQVYSEMFRVLRPGGRIAISDVLKEFEEQLPEHLRTAQALAC